MYELIPYGTQSIDDEEIAAVVETLRSPYITQGPRVEEFEGLLRDYTRCKYAVAVSSGTAALHLAVAALDVPRGMEGITSPNTFVASSNSLIYGGLKPVFADIDARTYNIDPPEIEKRITANTRILIPVHFAGQTADMVKIKELAAKNNLYIIEDAAHAIGSKYEDGAMVGCNKYADMTVFSFHPVKSITTGEGGAITMNSADLYNRLKLLRSHGITRDEGSLSQNPGPWYYEMIELGFNYRITDFQAALGIEQIKKLDSFIKRRREIVSRYNEAFSGNPYITVPYEREGGLSVFHLYVLQIDFDALGKSRRQVMEELKARRIGTQVHYIPVHLQPYYRRHFGYRDSQYPVAERYYSRALSLPLFPKMRDDEVELVIESLHEVIES